jgi:hypothetical protein
MNRFLVASFARIPSAFPRTMRTQGFDSGQIHFGLFALPLQFRALFSLGRNESELGLS